MGLRDNDLTRGALPPAFCWTKFGSEGGERVGSIFDRKETERRRNGGVFLWGIGTSILPSLLELLRVAPEPEVLFSPMKSAAAKKDAKPGEVVIWHDGVGFDGRPFALPEFSLVTSRYDEGNPRAHHFALVCQSGPIGESGINEVPVALNKLRNLRTGASIGASQVTSVVRMIPAEGDDGPTYSIAARSRLVHPYLVRFRSYTRIPSSMRLDRQDNVSLEYAYDRLIELRDSATLERPEQLALL